MRRGFRRAPQSLSLCWRHTVIPWLCRSLRERAVAQSLQRESVTARVLLDLFQAEDIATLSRLFFSSLSSAPDQDAVKSF